MSEFDAIRPYNDEEVRPVIDRMIEDRELLDAIVRFKFPRYGVYFAPLFRPLPPLLLFPTSGLTE